MGVGAFEDWAEIERFIEISGRYAGQHPGRLAGPLLPVRSAQRLPCAPADAEHLVDHPYIQSAADILSGAAERAEENNAMMAVLLDRWIAGAHRGDTGHG